MSLLGKAALAMWWDMAPDVRPDFEDWHSHEHFPERLGIPGFLRASRWRSVAGEGFFVIYELAAHDTLSSPDYLDRLNAPTPWSTRLMPHHRNMVRSQCRVLASAGGLLAHQVLTLQLQAEGCDAATLAAEMQALCPMLASLPGLVGVHLLRHEAPAIAPTTEQRIRGLGDAAADWVLLLCGYEAAALGDALAHEALTSALARAGATPRRQGHFQLSHSAVAGDVSGPASEAFRLQAVPQAAA